MTHINIFDRPYPYEKQMEGLAIGQAVVSGECFKCSYYKRCSSDETFRFPAEAACMKRKKNLMEANKQNHQT